MFKSKMYYLYWSGVVALGFFIMATIALVIVKYFTNFNPALVSELIKYIGIIVFILSSVLITVTAPNK